MEPQFPSAIPTFNDLNPNTSLAANNHASRHNKVHAEVAAIAEKVGTDGSSDPTSHENRLSSLEADLSSIIATAIAQAKQEMYPVGTIYYNAGVDTNPATLLGFGTWVRWGDGRVPVGVDSTQTEFDGVEETGGDKNLQAHTHTRGTMNIATQNDGIRLGWNDSSGGGIMMVSQQDKGALYTTRPSGDGYWWAGPTASGGAGVNTQYHTRLNFDASRLWTGETSTAGTGSSQNLQPYITVYMWKRTA